MKTTTGIFGAAVIAAVAVIVATGADSPVGGHSDPILIVSPQGYYLLELDANGAPVNHKIEHVVVLGTTPPTPPPVVVPPVVPPSGTLSDVVRAAIAAVPDYPNKQTHQREMAVTVNFLAVNLAKIPPDKIKDAIPILKQGCDIAVGADAVRWAGFWAAVNAKLTSLNLTTLGPSLAQLEAALIANLPPASADMVAEFMGRPTYGVDINRIIELFTKLLPLIELIMKLLV